MTKRRTLREPHIHSGPVTPALDAWLWLEPEWRGRLEEGEREPMILEREHKVAVATLDGKKIADHFGPPPFSPCIRREGECASPSPSAAG